MNLPTPPLPSLQTRMDEHKACVLVPTYNNAATLEKLVREVLQYTRNVYVVNDGATDGTAEILAGIEGITIIRYGQNVGKGWALRKGFEKALEDGYEYAITLDSDGQHFPADLPKFLEKLDETGPALIIGARNMEQAGIPGKSSFGHKFSNFWYWVETGIKAPDTQSGYRLYPISLLKGLGFRTVKFEFEIEVIVRAAWKGIRVDSVPVSIYYAPGPGRVTHFRPFKDFTRISILNTVLVTLALVYFHPRNFIRSLFKKETYTNLRKQIFNPDESDAVKALSIAFGVLMGIVPIWGFQLAVGIPLSILFRLNTYLFVLSAHVSIPPMIPLILYLSYVAGGIAMGIPNPLRFDWSLSMDVIHQNFIQYLVGSIIFAVLASVTAGLFTFASLKAFRRRA